MASAVLLELMDGFVEPPLEAEGAEEGQAVGGIFFDETCCANVAGATRVYELLESSAFHHLGILVQYGLLDILFLILRRSFFDVVRFRSIEKDSSHKSIVTLLLRLLDLTMDQLLSKRIIRLIGVVGQVAITAKEMRNFLERLKTPNELSLSLLQSFKLMLRQDDSSGRYSHSSFFSFGGYRSGLFSHASTVFIKQELQMSMWFRVESFVLAEESSSRPRLLWCSNEELCCLDIFIDGRNLCFYVDQQATPVMVRVPELTLKSGVWYYLHVSFMKHRWSLWNKNQLIINLDNKAVYQEFVKLPRLQSSMEEGVTLPKLAIGHHFNGQIGNVYFFSESIIASTMEVLSRSATGKFKEGNKVIFPACPW